LIQNVATNAVK